METHLRFKADSTSICMCVYVHTVMSGLRSSDKDSAANFKMFSVSLPSNNVDSCVNRIL